jgi:DNA-binding transcriptional MerR regulator
MATFDDGKEAGALRTIGEVAKATGIKAHVLRYWEQQFPMLKPLTRSGGRRYYRPEDVELVERIDRLVNQEGYTLKGAKAALRGAPDPQAATQPQVTTASPPAVDGDLLARLKAMRAQLVAALD